MSRGSEVMTAGGEFRNAMDELVVGNVRKLLGNPDIGISDDFLAAGGNSIVAIRLGQALREELGIPRITGVILKNPVLSDLSDALSALAGEAA
ncbi:phosphopantetheine-binding protein [Nonomuraea sp. NPDC050786]|uniref:phosphopantetheine-binding protein n=1 Tax=Nonomuraea sp. NPDC050786 TaxID=3154840 RepID=UPI0033D9CA7E